MSYFIILFNLAPRMDYDAKVEYQFVQIGHVAHQIHSASGNIFCCITVMFFNFRHFPSERLAGRVGAFNFKLLGTT